jgi:opacity protein-like surface antigen
MKKLLLFIVSIFWGLTNLLFPQNINGRFTSALYTFERFDTVNNSNTYARTYQMLYFTFGKDNVSLKSYLNLEADLSESQTYDPRFRFYNLYVDVRDLFDVMYLKLGRQPLFNSIGGGTFDGLMMGFKYEGFDINGYYGGNVPAYQKFSFTDDLGNDFVAGGKITYYSIKNTRLALKYLNKNFKSIRYTTTRLSPEFETNPNYIIDNSSEQYEYITAEVSYDEPNIFRVDTKYDYDLNFSTTSKFEIQARYEEIENLGISAYYNFREPKIRYNSIFSVFDFQNSQEIEIGGDYLIDKDYRIIGKFGSVSYTDESSQRVSLGVSSTWGTLMGRKTFGYAGELSSVSVYTARTICEGLLTPSLSLAYTNYKLSSDDDSNDMVTLLVGLNYRPMRIISFDVQGQYLNNKIYNNDFRLLLKLNYWFNVNFQEI